MICFNGTSAGSFGSAPLALLGAVLAASAVVLCHHVTEPFAGVHEWNSAWMSSAARAELEPWLAARYPGQRVELLGQPYLIFHIPEARDST